MNKDALMTLAAETARHIKTPEDLSELTRLLTKTTLEAALNAELDDHLAREQDNHLSNSRNGYNRKKVSTESGSFELTKYACLIILVQFLKSTPNTTH